LQHTGPCNAVVLRVVASGLGDVV